MDVYISENVRFKDTGGIKFEVRGAGRNHFCQTNCQTVPGFPRARPRVAALEEQLAAAEAALPTALSQSSE